MKILSVHCKNINSLEGDTRIDFTQAPFANSGAFAITGANGSGKSSILDAITLGLYGETSRSQSLTGAVAEHVMTRNTDDCFAEVEFALNTQRYRSSWSVQRQGKAITPAQMQLTHVDSNEVLADSTEQVCKQITELTGMNFRNFTRAMLLAQGDFAAFLNALDNERLDILEKIVGTDSYERYKDEVLYKATKAQLELQRLQEALQTLEVPDPVKREAFALDLADFNEQIASLQTEQSQLRHQHDALKNISSLQVQVKQQEQKLKVAETLAQAAQEQLSALLVDEDALVFADDLTSAQNQATALQQSQSALATLQTELQQLQAKLSNAVSIADIDLNAINSAEQQQAISSARIELSTLTANRQAESSLWQSLAIQLSEKKSTLALNKTWLEDHAADAALLTAFPNTDKIKAIRAELLDVQSKQQSFELWAKTTSTTLKKNQEALDKASKKSADLTAQQQADETQLKALLQNNSLEELESLQAEQYQRVQDFQELLYLAQAHEKLMSSGFNFFWKRKVTEPQALPDVNTLTAELEQLHLDIRREENIKRVLETAIAREALVKKLAVYRQHLVDDEPCHLCGALQHPYASHPPLATNTQQALVDQQAKIRALVTSANTLRVRIKDTQQQSVSTQSKNQKAQQVSSQWVILVNRLNASSRDLKIGNIALQKQLLATETEELKNINSLLNLCQRKGTAIEKTKAALAKNTLVVKQLQDTVRQTESVWQHRTQEQQESVAMLEHLQQAEAQELQELGAQLQQLGETLPEAGQEDALLERLKVRRRDYENYQSRLANFDAELESLQSKQAACQTEMAHYDGLFAQLNAKVQREESIGLHLSIIEKQSLIAEKQTLLAQQQSQLQSLEQAVQEKISASRFGKLNVLQDTLKRLEQLPSVQKRSKEQQADLIKKANTLISLQEQLMQLQSDTSLEGLHFDKINEQLRAVNEQLDIAKFESRRLTQLVQHAEQNQQQYDSLAQQLQQQQLIAQPQLEAAEQLKAENPVAQRRRLQQSMIEQLLTQTNTHLEKISGRYYLRQSFSEQGLALIIEDTYQANTQRALKTLSGGESFIISLALALGLSELANNGKSVDSLFLDEGFGNLDAENLYMVINTLEGLHKQGKTIGVISHVEAVQKRFKTQLQVSKKSNGYSLLKAVS